ncbi:MAG: AraC family ligand binding domain-containing protein [Butyricicoccus pullicaecorum]|nr:AraC family ligand binding domain-containing protein [Butyricicoccus pullicaecorum]
MRRLHFVFLHGRHFPSSSCIHYTTCGSCYARATKRWFHVKHGTGRIPTRQ